MTSFKEFLEDQLLDEEFAANYEEVSAEMNFALAVVMRREKLGLTQEQLAESIGMKQPMLARIEGGQMPSPRTLQRLAKGLKVGLLFTGDGIILLPMAGSKAGAARTVVHPVSEREWKLPKIVRGAMEHRPAECDYTLLGRESRRTTTKQKEIIDAGIATAA